VAAGSRFLAAGGSQSPAASGPVPAGWSLARATAGGRGSVTTALEPDPEGPDNVLHISFALSGGQAGETWNLTQFVPRGPGLAVQAGDVVEAWAGVATDGAPFTQASLWIVDNNGSTQQAAADLAATGQQPLGPWPVSLVERTPALVVQQPAGSPSFRVVLKVAFDSSASFSGNVWLRLPTLRHRPD
jgi:hypothetical protein